jgi:hypothetical protein
MSLSDSTLRAVINMLADERTAHVAMQKLRDAAAQRRMLVADLIASVASGTTSSAPSAPSTSSASRPAPPSPPSDPSDAIEVAIGKRIDRNFYGLVSEIIRETDLAWLVRMPGGGECWLPKSQTEHRGEDPIGRAILIVPTWLARKKNFI